MSQARGARRSFCPILGPRTLGGMRRHRTCGRPLRFLPGMLDTHLSQSGRAERLLFLPDDLFVVEYRGEGNVSDDAVYSLELGPRYAQYRLDYYTQGRVLGSCEPPSIDEDMLAGLLGLQRLLARRRPDGRVELCGTNNTIIPEDDNTLYSVGLLHVVELRESEGWGPPPWFVDRSLAPRLSVVEATVHAVGWVEEGLASEDLVLTALHPDPSGAPKGPHLAFAEWNKETRSLSLTLLPLYSLLEEYSTALSLGSLYLLTVARVEGSPLLRDLRKTYKKLSRHLEKAGASRPQGGVPGLLESPPGKAYSISGEESPVELVGVCSACEGSRPPGWAGLRVLAESLASGALLIL